MFGADTRWAFLDLRLRKKSWRNGGGGSGGEGGGEGENDDLALTVDRGRWRIGCGLERHVKKTVVS